MISRRQKLMLNDILAHVSMSVAADISPRKTYLPRGRRTQDVRGA